MKDLAPEQFIAALKEEGHDGQEVVTRSPEPRGVNVWFASTEGRLPVTTVWFPRPGHPEDGISWGPHLDNTVHRDITAEALVERVEERSD